MSVIINIRTLPFEMTGENCVMRSFMISTRHNFCFIELKKMSFGAYGFYWEKKKTFRFLVWKPE
jgi:hypothetical protein